MTVRSPLHELHAELGAKFVAFGGWEMPVHYRSVIAEHRQVRSSAGWFDVSHLGRFLFRGEGATETIRRLLCNDVARIGPGRSQYTMMLNEAGGVVDDLIVWRWGPEDYWILPNATNHERVMASFAEAAPGVELVDLRPSTVALAVQGPDAPAHLAALLDEAPRRFRTVLTAFRGVEVRAAGTGYTGEPGGEVVLPIDVAESFARALCERGVVPAGLGARDTLRLEAGLPLWGQELDEETTPLETHLEFAVSFEHDFVGRAALEAERRTGLRKELVGFVTEGRQIPRHGYRLRAGSSEGAVTSGNFSPMLERGIGLGYLTPPPDDEPIEVEIRGAWIPVDRVDPPFYRRSS